ncbi:outer membrane protein assembly factor BamA [Pelagimonas sp. KU-00592-HH]|uniref:outer membrane protein assembly factor BamA n=1 Tax=Pelagimonas sp. KU-00592-HH TaxID=3127651 RepID=UPI003342A99F
MTNHNRAAARAIAVETTWLRKFHLAVFLFVSAIFLALPLVANAQEYRFTRIDVTGNERIESAAILNYAGIERGKSISPGALNEGYQRILASGLFESVELEPRGNLLRIRVVEYPTINRVSIEGNQRLKDDALTSLLESKPRHVLNPEIAERDAARIADAYNQSGRVAARVTPRIIRLRDNRADLVFEIFEGGVTEVARIGFVGNKAYSDRRLRRVLSSKQAGILRALIRSDTFVEDRIEFDKQVLRDFYLSRGFVDFRITGVNAELARDRDAYFLTFNVQEGQQFTFGEITATSDVDGVDADEYLKSLKIKPGVIYTPLLVENSIARMERLAIRNGRDFLRVDPRITRNERDLSLDVEFVIERGPRIFVERIDIEGNTTTLDRVIRSRFRIAEGDPFNAREIRESAERIRALGYFETAEVNAREGSTPDQVVVDVDVVEQPTGSLGVGGSYSTNSGVGLAVQFSEQNFLGRGQRVDVSFSTTSDIRDYAFRFYEPRFLGRDLGFGFDLSIRENEADQNRWSSDVSTFKPVLEFPVSEFGRLRLNYTAQKVGLEVGDATVNPGSIVNNEASQGDKVKSSFGYSYVYDTRNKGLDVNRGVYLNLSQDFGGVGGDFKFISTTLRAVAEAKILREEVGVRVSFDAGMLHTPDDDSRVTDRFFLGPTQMRGFEPFGIGPRENDGGTLDDAIGGRYFAVARFETEFPLGLPEEYGIRGGLFYDVGSVWGSGQTSAVGSVLYDDFTLRHVIGFSLLWDTQIGPLRFDFTKALQKEAFDQDQSFNFSINAQF